jgi:hypothetical protein
MTFPVRLNFFDCPRKRVVGAADKRGRLRLRAIRVDIVSMAEAVRVVESHHRLPGSFMPDLKLHGVREDSLSLPLISAPESSKLGGEFLQPFALDYSSFNHCDNPSFSSI